MPRVMKLSLAVVGGLVGLILVLMLALILLVDPNAFRPEIEAAVEDATGRELTIDGDLELSVFPWIGIVLGRTELSDVSGDEPMLAVDEVQLKLELLPLLSKRIEAERIVLAGLDLNLRRDAEGVANWEMGTADDAAGPEAGQPGATDGGAAPDGGIADLRIGGLELHDARISFRDEVAGTDATLSGLSLATGPIAAGDPTRFELALALASAEPALDARLEAEGVLQFDAAFEQILLPSMSMTLGASGAGLGELDQVSLSASLDALTLDLAAARHSLTSLRGELAAQGEALPGGALDARFGIDALEADLGQDTLRITELSLDALGLAVRADLQGDRLSAEPTFSGALSIAEFSPRELLASLGSPMETTDPTALATASLQARYALGDSSVGLEGLDLRLDDTTISGSLGAVTSEGQALRFRLVVDAIDADRYLPPASEEGADAAEGDPDAVELPHEELRGLDLDGQLSVGSLRAMGMEMTELEVSLRAVDDVLSVRPLRAQLYQGSVDASLVYDVSGRRPRFQVSEEVDAIHIGPLLRDFAEVDAITGTFSSRTQLNGRGPTVGDVKRSMDGQLSLELADGTLEGVDLWHEIRRATAAATGGSYDGQSRGRTRISELSASAVITDGVVDNQDLVARLPFMQVTGAGTADVPAMALDYRVEALIVRSPELEGDALAEALFDIPVPVTLRGPLDDPAALEVRPDIQAVLEEKARRRIEEEAEELEDDLRDRLRRSIFGDG